MKLNFKILAAVTAVVSLFSCSSVFAETAGMVYYNEECESSVVESVPSGAMNVTVSPSKDQLAVGDDFYVDFIINNNSGFASFGIKIEYDDSVVVPVKGNTAEMNRVCEVKYFDDEKDVPAISAVGINSAIDRREENNFFYGNICLTQGTTIGTADDDGVLFRVNFKAVAEGKTDIKFSALKTLIFGNDQAIKVPAYVTNASVTVGGGSGNKAEVNSEKVSENETETASENSGSGKTEDKTENKTEAVSEQNSQTQNVEKETENTSSENLSNNSDNFVINLPKEKSSPKNFGDIASVPWAKESISSLSSLGIINGVDNVTFNPKAYTYRSDFVLVITRLLGLDGKGENTFSDVADSAYYADAVSLASKFDIVKGSDGKFMPRNNITRQDVMVILSRVLEKAGKLQKGDSSVLNGFGDSSNMVSMGIVKGDNNNMINPKGYINRAEMAVLIDRVYDVLS